MRAERRKENDLGASGRFNRKKEGIGFGAIDVFLIISKGKVGIANLDRAGVYVEEGCDGREAGTDKTTGEIFFEFRGDVVVGIGNRRGFTVIGNIVIIVNTGKVAGVASKKILLRTILVKIGHHAVDKKAARTKMDIDSVKSGILVGVLAKINAFKVMMGKRI